MYRGWRLRPLQNSSFGGVVASKHRQGRWIVTSGAPWASRMAPPSPPELEFWRVRSLQTPTGPMDRDFGSSLNLQDKLVELPNTSSSRRAASTAVILNLQRPRSAPSKLPASFQTPEPPNTAHEEERTAEHRSRRMVRRNARSA